MGSNEIKIKTAVMSIYTVLIDWVRKNTKYSCVVLMALK